MNHSESPASSLRTQVTLIARVRDVTDQNSWSEFVALYEPLLTRYVSSRGIPECDVRDVVQSIFIKLLRELPHFQLDHERGRFRTWLYKVAQTSFLDYCRQRKRQAKLAAEIEDIGRAELLATADDTLEFAKEHQRRVLSFVLDKVRLECQPQTWKCFEQTAIIRRPTTDIARELELNVSNVYVNASRVLAKVRERCAEFMESISDDEFLPS